LSSVFPSLNPFKGIVASEYIGYSGVIRIGSKRNLRKQKQGDALRALAAFILGYKGDHTDQCLIKDSYDSENSSMVKRGIVCGLIPMPKAERNYFLKYHKHDSWIMKIACDSVEKE
jgi:hypothetical protein